MNTSAQTQTGFEPDYRARALRDRATGEWLAAAIRATVETGCQAWRAYRRWRGASALRDTLAALDDRTLYDIGVHRSEIAAIGSDIANDSVSGSSRFAART